MLCLLPFISLSISTHRNCNEYAIFVSFLPVSFLLFSIFLYLFPFLSLFLLFVQQEAKSNVMLASKDVYVKKT